MNPPSRSTSCPDWAARLRAGRSIIPPPIFQEQADLALQIFRRLRIVDAPGSPTFGESCATWVFDLVASIFGSYDAATGRRLITEWFILIPKKNAKSTIAAGIMMTAIILNWRQSAEFAILAPTIEVANNSYGPARDMVQRDEDLDALMHVQTHVKTITHRESGAILKVVAADSHTVGGKKSVGTLVDELWLFGTQPKAENMLREAIGGLASRPEGFVIYLTTQSDDPPAGVFKQKLEYARAVRDGKITDDRFVPVIFEHPPEMVATGEHTKLENIAMVNPNMGFSVDPEFIQREYHKAKAGGDASFLGFLAKHADVEIGLALGAGRWAGTDYWEGCAVQRIELDELLERSEVVTIGIDGGGLDDMLGLAVLGREAGTRRWLLWSHAWIHAIVLERRKSEAARFRDFEREGDLTIVTATGPDIQQLGDVVEQVEASGLLDEIGVDQAGIGAIVDEIVARGIAFERIVGIPQGWKLVGAIKTTERKLAAGEFHHGGTGLMAYAVGNAKVEPRGNAIVITKQTAGAAKIDPLMALFDAVSLMSMNPKPRKKNYDILFMA